MRRCAKTLILSTYALDLKDCFIISGLEQENFILKCLYEAGLMWLYYERKTMSMSDYSSLCHEDIGCIFDFNINKKNVYQNMFQPFICPDCKRKLIKKINKDELIEFENKLSEIKKPLFYTIKDWCVYHPILTFVGISILAGFLASIGSELINIIKSMIELMIK